LRDAFIRKLEDEARANSNVFLLTGDLGFGVVEKFAEEFPNQFLNAGVAEQNMMGMAAGLADSGKLPFVYSIANFPTFRCLEQIRNDVCYPELPVTVVSIGAGLAYGTLGYSHHAVEDLAVMRALPGMRVLSPCDPQEVEAAVALIIKEPAPTYLRLGKNGEPKLGSDRGQLLKSTYTLREGKRVLVLATGSVAGEVLRAVEETNNQLLAGAKVASVPVIKPMDLSALELDNFEYVVSVEEHSLAGGFNTAIFEYLRGKGLTKKILGIGLADELRHGTGSAEHLRSLAGIDSFGIQNKIIKFLDVVENH
jgi:transketolase